MFGKLREIVLHTMKINVCEIFVSIQGESSRAGELCTFIRLSGCSLRCSYCDTRYSYDKGRDYSISELVEIARTSQSPLVEITGGEPLDQIETPALAQALINAGFTVIVETNGNRDISKLPAQATRIMDIKTPGSGEVDSFFETNISALLPHDEVKFVLTDRNDYDWAKKMITCVSFPCLVIFSPCEKTLSKKKLAEWIVADRLSVRFGIQLHKIIWDSEERGV